MQQPPNPGQPYQQQPTQPPYYQPQQTPVPPPPYQYGSYPPQQPYYPQKPPKKKRGKGWLIALGVVILVLFVGRVASYGSSSPSDTNAASVTTPHTKAPTQAPTKASIITPRPTPIAKLTTAQKNQVRAILNASIQHYQDLLTQGKSILGTTPYADGSAGLVAMNDPNSNASKFSAWRQTSKAETDLSFLDAFKQADAFYNADNEPGAISTWRDDMGTAQSDLAQWVSVAVDWQISAKTTNDLNAAEATFDQDIKQAQADVAATLSAS